MCYNECMKIVSYNINGIRASKKNGILDWFKDFDADIYCIQEVRANQEVAKKEMFNQTNQISFFESESKLKDYHPTFNCGNVAGYAGTLTMSKIKPDKVLKNMNVFWQDKEGRTTTTFFGNLAVVNAYIPNGNSRLEFKMDYLKALNSYLKFLSQNHDVICVGDYNIAHNEIDLTNPRECKNKSVFLPEERRAFSEILNSGFIDAFRFLNPTKTEYSWRSYKSLNEKEHKGYRYRIDYALVSKSLKDKLKKCEIIDLPYSDHLPVLLELES